jgi:surface antigen
MMNGRWTALALGLALGAGPASAQGLDRYLTGENVGKAVGAVAGALLGAQIGGGTGKLAAVAVGTLAGYWVGGEVGRRLSQRDQQGIAQTTQTALDTGETQTWRNPETGVYTRVSVEEPPAGVGPRLRPALAEVPALELVNAYYTADANLNVRGGPGTDYVILRRLARGERVPVVGRVTGSDWYLIAEDGRGSGFVYAPLLAPAEPPAGSGNAIREAMLRREQPRGYPVEEDRCRLITQEVVLPDGSGRTHDFKACRQADGSWVEV